MEKSKVAIVKGERGLDSIFKALDLIDYQSALKGFQEGSH